MHNCHGHKIHLSDPQTITEDSENRITSVGHSHEIEKASQNTAGIVKVVDHTESTDPLEALSANQGRILAEALQEVIHYNKDETINQSLDAALGYLANRLTGSYSTLALAQANAYKHAEAALIYVVNDPEVSNCGLYTIQGGELVKAPWDALSSAITSEPFEVLHQIMTLPADTTVEYQGNVYFSLATLGKALADGQTEIHEIIQTLANANNLLSRYILTDSGNTQQENNDLTGAPYRTKDGGYSIGERVVLTNGDIVKSTIDGNTNNPNTDISGWVLTSDSKQLSFKSSALSSTMRTVFDKLEEQVSVKDFGAKGDGVADDTAAINLAIAYASQTPVSKRVSSVVYFPAGIYRITSTLTVTANGVELRGEYESGANMNESALGYGSTHIYYDAENGLPAIKFGKPSGLQWGNGLRGIRISANLSLVNKPIGLQLAGLSEVHLRDFHINLGFAVGLDSISSAGVWLYNFDIGNSDINMRISSDIAKYGFMANQMWINSANLWNARYDHIKINAPATLYMSESWMEFAQRFINIEQVTDARMRVEISIDSSEASVAIAYSPNDPTYNVANNRIIKARALDGAAEPLEVYFETSNNSKFYVENADYAFEYIRGTNQNASSRFTEAALSNSKIYGVNIAGVHSDTTMSSLSAMGNVECRASLFNEVLRPIASANCQLNALVSKYGYWDMSAGRPLRLPQKPAIDYSLDGQVYFNTVQKRVQYTCKGAIYNLTRPEVLVLGDQNYTYDSVNSPETVIFNAPLSGTRSIGFDATNAYGGQKVRVCRTAASSGESIIGVIANGTTVKQLNSGQWCDLEFGSGIWYVTASGNL